MFSDRYGLEQAVLECRKTMTRRLLTSDEINRIDFKDFSDGRRHFPYLVGEKVAVAQRYKDVVAEVGEDEWNSRHPWNCVENLRCREGWNNKMYVKADLMPHCVVFTNVKMERLQDITEEEALLEGVYKYDKPPLHHESDFYAPWSPDIKPYKHDMDNLKYRATARYAFAYLVDKVCGGGTWKSNPWVIAYSFVLL